MKTTKKPMNLLEKLEEKIKELGISEDLSHEEKVKAAYPEMYEQFGQNLLSKEEIEKSIQKKYRNVTMSKFTKALKDYELLKEGDKVAVAISGGKDSILCAKMFQALQLYSDYEFSVEYFCMDPGYLDVNRQLMEFNLTWLGIPAYIYDSDVFEVSEKLSKEKKPCYLCARMRRGFLYAKAQELGCNKVALGHHFNDVIETTLMNVLWSANYKVMMPKIQSLNFENMELIRPLYLIHEEDVIAWRNHAGLRALDCACTVTNGTTVSQRKHIKDLIKSLKETNPNVEKSIFRSGENVAIDAILGYTKAGEKHSFLEHYGDEQWTLSE